MTVSFVVDDAPGAVGAPVPVVGQLPAQLLHVAAQFASDDPAKPALNCVHVLREQGQVRIASTNSHYAFRCVVATDDEGCGGFWLSVPELFLERSALVKRSPYAQTALVRADGELRLYGAKRGQQLGLLEARPCGNVTAERRTAFPPGFDRLWPSEISNNAGAPVAFNAGYMRDICAVVERYSPNGVLRWESNEAHKPLRLTADFEPLAGVRLDWLLMPVQLRE
ncbi:MAG: hypothetical protein ACO289_10770 [Prochlorococcaceae cyanobacterium]